MNIAAIADCSEFNCGYRHSFPSDSPLLCLFHAPVTQKGRHLKSFNTMLEDRIKNGGDGDFRHYVLPPGTEIKSQVFKHGADFSNASFHGPCFITKAEFQKDCSIIDVDIIGELDTSRLKFTSESKFHLVNPTFHGISGHQPRISFTDTEFPDSRSFFRIISSNANSRDTLKPPLLLFRTCSMEGVFFDDCEMSLFSFYSAGGFANAHFSSCTWPKIVERYSPLFFVSYPRHYLVPEELLLDQMEVLRQSPENLDLFCQRYSLPDTLNHSDIATLYRRMKVSLDSSKAYETSAWLYFNESEMRLNGLRAEGKWGMSSVFALYKYLAGFGERPLWSAAWFFAMCLIFGVVYLFAGFQTPTGSINYRFDLSLSGSETFFTATFWGDITTACLFPVLRIIPGGYLSGVAQGYGLITSGIFSILISILNLLVLTLLLIFAGVGFKRRFRRF